MTWRRPPTVVALGVFAFTAIACGAPAPLYNLAAMQSCLTKLPNAVPGLPPTRPPVPPALFVYALTGNAVSTQGLVGRRPRAHKQLGAWYGDRSYQGMFLSFFKSVPDARASLKNLAWLYGGKRIRNMVVTWAQESTPSRSVRNTVFACLRSGTAGSHGMSDRTPPQASLATFVGRWGGHTRGLLITPSGRGTEGEDSGCCTRVYGMTFQILSVSGTLTRASAVYRVTSFRRYEGGVRTLRLGSVGKLLLRNGIVTNTLTDAYFCSDPAWGATGACGA
jgi:hypothetical protein